MMLRVVIVIVVFCPQEYLCWTLKHIWFEHNCHIEYVWLMAGTLQYSCLDSSIHPPQGVLVPTFGSVSCSHCTLVSTLSLARSVLGVRCSLWGTLVVFCLRIMYSCFDSCKNSLGCALFYLRDSCLLLSSHNVLLFRLLQDQSWVCEGLWWSSFVFA